uniref:Ig-like domain-containing protein n=2 Tax=Gasterosteus aculeatus aculeatus TaxID=481459 RepID=A0AAQ4NWS9_GASAC
MGASSVLSHRKCSSSSRSSGRDEQSFFRTETSDMMSSLIRFLLVGLLPTVVRCSRGAVLLYSRLGGDALLPCYSPVPLDCSSITWTFYQGGRVRFTEEVREGRVSAVSDKSSRLTLASNCSLAVRDLVVDDAGSYHCKTHQQSITAVYLSLLAITSSSTVTELQPGGRIALSCTVFTYYDTGLCAGRPAPFDLTWASEDGVTLRNGTRQELIFSTRCSLTLVTKLRREDNNRKLRCQVSSQENGTAAFLDFTSAFLFQTTPTAQNPVQLPISRIVLCVALPVMVLIVSFFTWRGDRKRAKAFAAGMELQEMN